MNLPEPIGEAALAFFQKLLGPVAEAGELLSDKVRFYRWKSSLKIIKKAEEVARKNKISPKEVPLKFLVPFLEKSSLEEEDSDMASQWANLLTSAISNPKEADIPLIDILSKLGSKEVKILEGMISRDRVMAMLDYDDPFAAFVSRGFANRFGLGSLVSSVIRKAEPKTTEDVRSLCVRYMSTGEPHAVIECIEYRFYVVDHDGSPSIVPNESVSDGRQISSYETLISLGLLNRSSYVNRSDDLELSVTILTPTLLAFRLVTQCRGDLLQVDTRS